MWFASEVDGVYFEATVSSICMSEIDVEAFSSLRDGYAAEWVAVWET